MTFMLWDVGINTERKKDETRGKYKQRVKYLFLQEKKRS